MVAVVLSLICPGLGQLYYGKWGRASVMFLAGVTPIYPVALVWSVLDAYRLSQKGSTPQFSRKEALVAIALPLVIVPVFVILLAFSTSHALAWFQDSYLDRSATLEEGADIAAAILAYESEAGRFPDDLTEVIGTRPLRASWLTDGWGRPYRYTLEQDGEAFVLLSAGRDGEVGTEDDLEWRP